MYFFLSFQIPSEICDSEFISEHLSNMTDVVEIISFIQKIRGPWSIIYYQKSTNRLYFGRDMYGRHSLLWKLPSSESPYFILSSVVNKTKDIEEVPALGLFYMDLNVVTFNDDTKINLLLWDNICPSDLIDLNQKIVLQDLTLKRPILNHLNSLEPDNEMIEYLQNFNSTAIFEDQFSLFYSQKKEIVDSLISLLKQSIQTRVDKCPKKCINCSLIKDECTHTKYAVLFSGGLDSAIIARLLDLCLPEKESIDLLNVAFEQTCNQNTKNKKQKNNERKVEKIVSFDVPDRISGRQCWEELCRISPKRKWNFVEVKLLLHNYKCFHHILISSTHCI